MKRAVVVVLSVLLLAGCVPTKMYPTQAERGATPTPFATTAQVVVPNVVGMTGDEAIVALSRFDVEFTKGGASSSWVVAAQEPKASEWLDEGSQVVLAMVEGEPVVVDDGLPGGFTAWPLDANVALKFKKKNVDCSYYDSCVNVLVYSIDGCPSGLYVEANIIDSSGVVVDYTNDSLGSLGADQQGLLVLGGFDVGSSTFAIQEVNCY